MNLQSSPEVVARWVGLEPTVSVAETGTVASVPVPAPETQTPDFCPLTRAHAQHLANICICGVDGCEKSSAKSDGGRRGLCSAHYQRWRRYGDPTSYPERATTEERFLRFTDKTTNATGCWLWTGRLHGSNGGLYGQLEIEGKNVSAHRLAYELYVGPIPDGLTIDHLCRVMACVNPAHLEAVTIQENILRGSGPTAKNAIKTHCPQGHPYNESNTKVYRGSRYCLACSANRWRAANVCDCGHGPLTHVKHGGCEGHAEDCFGAACLGCCACQRSCNEWPAIVIKRGHRKAWAL